MRIRSTRPVFWKSKTIADVSWDARLVLKALESYVDDNGVGKDDMEMIITECFGRDHFRNPTGTFRRVNEAVSELNSAHLISQYEMDGESLIYVENWKKHQYVQKPQDGRYPRPDGTLEYKQDVIPENYRKAPEASGEFPSGVGEKGSRGVGEKGSREESAGADDSASESFDLVIPEDPGPTEDQLFEAFWAEYPSKAGRKPAREKFTIALRRASAEEITDGAHRYAVDPNRAQAYTKHAATWLHNNGWEDPPLPPRQGTGKQTAIDREHQVHAERAARIQQLQNGGAGWQPKRMEA